jgi:alginate O-acetyltransferase complex protein AlgJ
MTSIASPLRTIIPALSVLATAGAIGFGTTRVPLHDAHLLAGSYQRAYEDGFAANMPFTDLAQAAYTSLTIAVFQEAGPEVVIAQGDWLFTAEEFRNPDASVDFPAELARYRALLAAQGMTLVPILVPDKARVYADLLPRPRSPEIEARYGRALSVISDLGLPAANLWDALVLGRAQGPTFMRTDTHWSPRGADLAAQAVAQAAGIVLSGDGQFDTASDAPTPFEGDLRAFVETGPFRPWVGPADELIQRSVTVAVDTGLGLFGAADIDAVLIGTSFSARHDFNFAGWLQEATGLSVVNLAVEGRGPFAPMEEALSNGAIADINPTIVFWEIPERYIHTRSLQ